MSVVVVVLRSGGDFQPKHVLRLCLQLRDAGHWLGRIVILTDVPRAFVQAPLTDARLLLRKWPGWWSKLEVCAPEQDDLGDVLYLDLDTTVVGAIDGLPGIATVGLLTLLQDFQRPHKLGSGVMYLPLEPRRQAWAAWLREEPERIMTRYWRTGDQAFFEMVWRGACARWQDVLPGQIVSFKEHVRQSGAIPSTARLICYHGNPRPWEIEVDSNSVR